MKKTFSIFLTVTLLVMTYVGAFAENSKNYSVSLKTTSSQAKIGDLINIILEIKVPENIEFSLEDPLPCSDCEVLNQKKPLTEIKEGIKTVVYQYEIIPFTLGEKELGPVDIRLTNSKTGLQDKISSNKITLKVLTSLSDKNQEIRDIKENLKISFPFWFYPVLISLLIISVIILKSIISHLCRIKKKNIDITEKTPEEKARARFQELKESSFLEKNNIKEYYQGLTDIIRGYFQERYSINAPEMTTSELIRRIKNEVWFSSISSELRELFLLSDKVKFSKFIPYSEVCTQSFNSAMYIYEKIEYRQPEKDEEKK